MRWFLDPERIRQLTCEQFIVKVTTHNGGLRQQRRLRQIWEEAGNSIGCRPGSAMKLEAELLVDTLKSIKEQLVRVEKAIDELAKGFEEYGYLKSIPGFGPYVSAMVLAAIGNAHRFENRAQLIRLAGFDLSANRSSEKSKAAVPVIVTIKRRLIFRQDNPPKKRSENMQVECCQKSWISSTICNHALIK